MENLKTGLFAKFVNPRGVNVTIWLSQVSTVTILTGGCFMYDYDCKRAGFTDSQAGDYVLSEYQKIDAALCAQVWHKGQSAEERKKIVISLMLDNGYVHTLTKTNEVSK